MSKKLLISATILLLISNFVIGQEFTIDAQLKPRYEHRNGFGALRPINPATDRPDDFVSQRSRLRFLFNDKNEKFKMGFSIQDVRTWGEINHFSNKDNGNLTIHEAYGELFFSKSFSAKVGRQELVYDDHRIFGSVDWAQQARSHDALVLKYEKNFKLHAGLSIATSGERLFYTPQEYYNPTSTNGKANSYKSMQYLWFHKDLENFKLSALFLNLGIEQTENANSTAADDYETVYQQTIGAHGEWKPGKFGLNFNVYYQFGKSGVGTSQKDISAYNIMLDLLFNPTDKLGLVLGGEILSGTSYTDAGGDETNFFNPYFGTNHKFNGHMDYFYVGGRNPQYGLTDIYVGATYKVDTNWKLYARYHYFASAADMSDGTAEISNSLGSEIDINANYKFNSYISIQGGWSAMFASDSMPYSTSANEFGDPNKFNNWGWLGIVIKPTLFSFKKEEAPVAN